MALAHCLCGRDGARDTIEIRSAMIHASKWNCYCNVGVFVIVSSRLFLPYFIFPKCCLHISLLMIMFPSPLRFVVSVHLISLLVDIPHQIAFVLHASCHIYFIFINRSKMSFASVFAFILCQCLCKYPDPK